MRIQTIFGCVYIFFLERKSILYFIFTKKILYEKIIILFYFGFKKYFMRKSIFYFIF